MLKGIPPVLTPDLLWAIAAMGHGDTLAVVDANYPAYALHTRVLPLAGADTATAIEAITNLMPIDTFIDPATWAMKPDGDADALIESHKPVAEVLALNDAGPITLAPLERTPFYAEAKGAFAVVLTGDTGAFACFLLTKGVVSQ